MNIGSDLSEAKYDHELSMLLESFPRSIATIGEIEHLLRSPVRISWSSLSVFKYLRNLILRILAMA